MPVDEQHPCNPTNYYGVSKYSCEKFLQLYSSTTKIPVGILRISSVYGKGMPEYLSIPKFINLINNYKSIKINGDGENRQDYIYIKDVISSIEQSIYLRANGVFNISSGVNVSLNEIINDIGKLINKTPDVAYIKSKQAQDYMYDISAAKKMLKWKPEIGFMKGIEKLVF